MIGFNIFKMMQNKKYNKFVKGFQSQSDGSFGLPSSFLCFPLGIFTLINFFFFFFFFSSRISDFDFNFVTNSLLVFLYLIHANGDVGGSGPPQSHPIPLLASHSSSSSSSLSVGCCGHPFPLLAPGLHPPSGEAGGGAAPPGSTGVGNPEPNGGGGGGDGGGDGRLLLGLPTDPGPPFPFAPRTMKKRSEK